MACGTYINQLSPHKNIEDLIDAYGERRFPFNFNGGLQHSVILVDLWIMVNSETPDDSPEVVWPSGEKGLVLLAYNRLFANLSTIALWVKSVWLHCDIRWGHLKSGTLVSAHQ